MLNSDAFSALWWYMCCRVHIRTHCFVRTQYFTNHSAQQTDHSMEAQLDSLSSLLQHQLQVVCLMPFSHCALVREAAAYCSGTCTAALCAPLLTVRLVLRAPCTYYSLTQRWQCLCTQCSVICNLVANDSASPRRVSH
jgi:hypothetical protein